MKSVDLHINFHVIDEKRPADAVTAHCKGSVKRRLPTNGGMQEMKVIPEGDLYRLIVNSELPAAETFESWPRRSTSTRAI